MRISVPTPLELASLLARPFAPSGPRRLPISDPAPDPGLFGPASVTWEVMKEPALVLGGGRALLMQAAHPLVAQGAIDHSSYAVDPFGRLERTMLWVTRVTFGTTAEARDACRVVNRLHRRVAGVMPAAGATPAVPAGTPYTALDERLLLWVHATFVDTMLVAHDALVGGLDDGARDAFVHEWDAVARLMGVPQRMLWRDRAELRDYVDEQLGGPVLRPGPGARRISLTIVRPPLPTPALRPLWEWVAFVTVGLLPPRVRGAYGIRWTPAHDAAHAATRLWLRNVRAVAPRRLRTSPVHDAAHARLGSAAPGRRAA